MQEQEQQREREILHILEQAKRCGGSDIILTPGARVSVKVDGAVVPIADCAKCGGADESLRRALAPADTRRLLEAVYALGKRDPERAMGSGDDDFSFSVPRVGRFRCNAFKQRNSMAMVLRIVSFELPDPALLGIPDSVMQLAGVTKGLVLVTGPAGSGKSTTLACLIDRINGTCRDHIITIEDPIEFLHPHKKSVVTQREVEHDTENYASALRAALRQAPDVILIGEMRDLTTIQTALTAAETGQLVLSTLHTVGAAKTIDRIIDVFPAGQQQQIRVQLSMVLRAVVSQQLLPRIDGGRVAAFEIMKANPAIQNMIRESKVHQMDNVIYAGADAGMRAMDADILDLVRRGVISDQTALAYAVNPDLVAKKLA